MTEKALDEADVDAGFEQARRSRVAQHVRGDAAGEPGSLGETAQASTDAVGGHPAADLGLQERCRGGCTVEAVIPEERAQLSDHFARSQEHLPFAIALAANPQRPALEIDVADPQGREFGYAHAGGEEQQHRERDRRRRLAAAGEETAQFDGGEAARQALGQTDPYLGGAEG